MFMAKSWLLNKYKIYGVGYKCIMRKFDSVPSGMILNLGHIKDLELIHN